MKKALSFILAVIMLMTLIPSAAFAATDTGSPKSAGKAALTSISVTAGNNASSGKITLKWNAVDGADKYEIWRSSSKTGSFKRQYTTTKTSYINSTAVAGKTYYYLVKALNAKGKVVSESKSVSRVCDCAAPVVSSSIVASTGKIKLTWKPVDGAVKYEVWRSTSKTGTYTKQYTTTGTKYTNTAATAGYTYYYKVKAIGASSSANSAFSNITYRTCDCAKMNVAVDWNEKGNVVFSWDKVSGATSYKVYRSNTSKGTYKLLAETKSTTYTDTTAKVGYYYHYKFVAVSSRSSAADSAPLMGTACPVPAQPKNLKVTKDYGNWCFKLTWNAVSGADGYYVLMGDSANVDIMFVSKPVENGTSTTYPFFFRPENGPQTRYVCIVAYKELSNGDIVLSEPSNIVSFTENSTSL